MLSVHACNSLLPLCTPYRCHSFSSMLPSLVHRLNLRKNSKRSDQRTLHRKKTTRTRSRCGRGESQRGTSLLSHFLSAALAACIYIYIPILSCFIISIETCFFLFLSFFSFFLFFLSPPPPPFNHLPLSRYYGQPFSSSF